MTIVVLIWNVERDPPGQFRKWVAGLEREIPPSYLKAIDADAEVETESVGAGGA